MTWWHIALVTLGAAVIFPGLLRPVLRKTNLVDVPNHRSSHTRVTLRGGGLAVAGAALVGGLLALASGESLSAELSATALPWAIFGAVAVAALGLAEDLMELPVLARIMGQFALSGLIGWGLVSGSGWSAMWAVLLAFAGVFAINAANFMDGVNGISALHGVLLGLTGVLVGARAGEVGLLVAGAIVSASFAGFLPWNFPKAKLFLGDVGSYFLGALFLTIGVWIFAVSGSLLLAIAPVSYYAFDVLITLLARAKRRENLTEAHRDHRYQQLQRKKQSHLVSTLVTSLVTVVLIGLAYSSWVGSVQVWLAAGLGLVVLLVFAQVAQEDRVSV